MLFCCRLQKQKPEDMMYKEIKQGEVGTREQPAILMEYDGN